MADFLLAIPYVLENEGGTSDNPNDKGGKTKCGITEAVAKAHGFDLETITDEQINQIYQADYWRFDQVKSQRVATKLLDMAVNFGLKGGIETAQKALFWLLPEPIPVDGIFGPKTLRGLNLLQEDKLLQQLAKECERRYHIIVIKDPSQKEFLNGWLKRAWRIPA